MPEVPEDIVLIQVGSQKVEKFSVRGDEQVIALIAKRLPQFTERLRGALERVAIIRREVISNPDKTVEYFEIQRAQAKTDILLNRNLEALTHEERVQQIQIYHRYTSVGSCLLYDAPNFQGYSKYIGATWPNLAWWPYNFNDRASSALVWGTQILYEHTWYGGKRLFMIGYPLIWLYELGAHGLDNRGSSYVSF
jgi:hypothetical protein